jgi:hypothetical protein
MIAAAVKYFALWGVGHAYTLDAYPEEFRPYAASWQKERQLFAGPFDDRREALKLALERCYALRHDGRVRKRKRPQPMVIGNEGDMKALDDLVMKVLKSR